MSVLCGRCSLQTKGSRHARETCKLQLGMLASSQAGQLAANPLQAEPLMPCYKSSSAQAWPLQKLCRRAAVSGSWAGVAVRSPPSSAVRLPKPICLPDRSCAALHGAGSLLLVMRKCFNDCSSLIGNCRIQRSSDFVSQLRSKSDSLCRLLSCHSYLCAERSHKRHGPRWGCELIANAAMASQGETASTQRERAGSHLHFAGTEMDLVENRRASAGFHFKGVKPGVSVASPS